MDLVYLAQHNSISPRNPLSYILLCYLIQCVALFDSVQTSVLIQTSSYLRIHACHPCPSQSGEEPNCKWGRGRPESGGNQPSELNQLSIFLELALVKLAPTAINIIAQKPRILYFNNSLGAIDKKRRWVECKQYKKQLEGQKKT